MATEFVKLFRQAADLSQKDRELLTDLLLDTLAQPLDPEIEAAWRVELDRRAKELDSGEVKGIPWEDVYAKMRGRLHAKSSAKKRRASSGS